MPLKNDRTLRILAAPHRLQDKVNSTRRAAHLSNLASTAVKVVPEAPAVLKADPMAMAASTAECKEACLRVPLLQLTTTAILCQVRVVHQVTDRASTDLKAATVALLPLTNSHRCMEDIHLPISSNSTRCTACLQDPVRVMGKNSLNNLGWAVHSTKEMEDRDLSSVSLPLTKLVSSTHPATTKCLLLNILAIRPVVHLLMVMTQQQWV